jgi:hypothetical protein
MCPSARLRRSWCQHKVITLGINTTSICAFGRVSGKICGLIEGRSSEGSIVSGVGSSPRTRVRGVRHDTLEQAAEARLKDVRPDAKLASCQGRKLRRRGAKILIPALKSESPCQARGSWNRGSACEGVVSCKSKLLWVT